MPKKKLKFDDDIRASEIVCWLAIRYEDLVDIKKNSVLAVKVDLAAGEHQTELRERYVAAAQDLTDSTYLEIDDNASVEISNSDDGGAYVQGWIWVDSSALEKAPAGPDHARRQQFVTNALLPSKIKKKKGSNGKKENGQKGSQKGNRKENGKGKSRKTKG